ncbi:D-alanyl-D-alanine carboxypeptidase family protein [Rubellimicrobium roseum]|uniref:serine-type D-Ala-D-Ala carboxypeptidase n=1 Tax=Rubellimicrobium roseum TaxID=687525 RepID=A0A5C4NMF2_9RHOB|nr:D-alanyl-D-alanine carboxypeptidase family protein [Rubellimicrobium roseum]TNC74578.1 D-alanyl-D-alanine carboxypeptidase [Rubellimicrobium roseum]
MTRLVPALALLLASALPAVAQEFQTAARAAWVYDETTGTVLLEKNADAEIPPASMSKLMTIYMAFDAIGKGQLTLDQTLPVSEHAMSYGGSTMFLNTLDRPTVEELLRGVIILSGNDATVVLAEALSPDGTEAGFAELMNRKAEELGMLHSHFENSNGWPAEGHVMSARDLGILAEHLIEDFPDLYTIFAEQEFDYDGRAPANTRNRNPILGLVPGADGLKTGHTQEAGYGLVGSAVQDDRRVIFVVTGLPSEEARRTESERIVNWAFRQFALRDVGEAGNRIAEAEVWMGAQPSVGLVLPEDLSILIPITGSDGVEASVSYQGPLPAPIEAGQEVAELVLTREGLPEMRLPLVAEAAVPTGGFMPRVQTALGVLLGKAGLNAGAIPILAGAPAVETPVAEPAEEPAPEAPAEEPAAEEPAPAPAEESEGLPDGG